MSEEILKKLKKDYLQPVDKTRLYTNWLELRSKLPDQKTEDRSFHSFGFPISPALAFAGLALLILGGTLLFSRLAAPGDSLYPVKILSDRVGSRITGNYEIDVEGRTEDIVDTSHDGERLDKAIEQYQKSIDQGKENAAKNNEQDKYNRFLEEQQQKLEETAKNNPDNEEKLSEVIEDTRRARGEIQGAREETEHSEDGNTHQDNDRED